MLSARACILSWYSPNSCESDWVEREYLYASNQKLKVIPILYKACDLPLWSLNLHVMELGEENYTSGLADLLNILGVETEPEKEFTPPPRIEPHVIQPKEELQKPIIEPVIPYEKSPFSRLEPKSPPEEGTPVREILPPRSEPAAIKPKEESQLPVIESVIPDEKSAVPQLEPATPPEEGMPVSKPGLFQKKRKTITFFIFVGAMAVIVALSIFLPRLLISPPGKSQPTPVHTSSFGNPIPTITPSFTWTISPTATKVLPTATKVTPTPTETIAIMISTSSVDGIPMVYVPDGPFQMGSVHFEDTQPVHTVTLDAFWIDQTEVTNGMYLRCAQARGCQHPVIGSSLTHRVYYTDPEFQDYPVVYITWEMANTYCTWAGRRLPTEAEWEKAARGTDARTYPWGEGLDCTRANYGLCTGDTTQVGSYPSGASPYGALDMAGNVREWVADWYQADYYQSLGENTSNPLGPNTGESGSCRVHRGGYAWDTDYQADVYPNSAYRDSCFNPTSGPGGPGDGFRCALSVSP